MSAHSFRASDGLGLACYIDDFTDPWRRADTVVMLHAAMSNSARLSPMVPALARHFRVVRLDLRGYGASEVPPQTSPLTMERLVRDVAELMDEIGCGAAHLMGNSAGGYLAQHLAMDAPERVRSLVLFGSKPGLKNNEAETWLPRIRAIGLRRFLADTIGFRFAPGTDPRLIEWYLNDAANCDIPYVARFVSLMTSMEWADRVHRIACPTLLVIAGHDADSPGHLAMRQRIPDVRTVIYDGMAHNICEAAPDRCAVDALAFLRERFPD